MDDLVFAGQIGERVQAALNDLSPQERAAFLMRHYHGCSIEEICEALDLKSNAAKHSIFRAVKKMRVALPSPRAERCPGRSPGGSRRRSPLDEIEGSLPLPGERRGDAIEDVLVELLALELPELLRVEPHAEVLVEVGDRAPRYTLLNAWHHAINLALYKSSNYRRRTSSPISRVASGSTVVVGQRAIRPSTISRT